MRSKRWRIKPGATTDIYHPRQNGEMSIIAVADTGQGIAPEVQAQLFRAFLTTKPHGMGVGLSISTDDHRGSRRTDLDEPNPGGGTIFRFTVRAVTREGRKRCRLMADIVHVVDDDEAMRNLMAFLLARWEFFRVQTSRGWLETPPRLYSQIKAGCVVTDVRMPGYERDRTPATLARAESILYPSS